MIETKARTYTAAKSRTQGRKAWAVTFRHPACRDDEGRTGVKVRRGLGTRDSEKADAFVAELNALLGDESYWNVAERGRAEQRFHSVVVRAFYEPMDNPAGKDPMAIREEEIPLPGRGEGYSRVMLIGTTGAGKTSLLRQLIGSHPTRDRFPSTSTGKTTIADIEVIVGPGDFEAVVTFFPRRLVRTYVSESVSEACKTAWRDGSDERVMRDLLNHKDQRFRLGYLLGAWLPDEGEPEEDDWGDGTEEEEPEDELDAGSLPTPEERAAMQSALDEYLERVRKLAAQADAAIAGVLDEPLKDMKAEDQEAAADLFVDQAEDLPGHAALVDAITEDVLRRFADLKQGTLTRRGGWPEKWTFRSDDRNDFMRQARWFSSNYHRAYGSLLTPVVQGMRVRGPFVPGSGGEIPRVVLIDGEGLGHTPESAANVSTHYTSRYATVDVVLVVDNATQPMQAAPLSVLRSVGTGGHADKLAVAFTHFDAVKGDNLPGFAAKRDHVLGAVKLALARLRDAIGDVVVGGLERRLDERCFMLGWLDRPAEGIPSGARKQLGELMGFVQSIIEPEPHPQARPMYDPAGLAFAVQSASREFHSLWDARLGYRRRDGVSKEHWARVKALTRRVTYRMDNYEYKHLMPVAELIGRLSEATSRFLDAPARWERTAGDQDEAAAAIARIRAEIYTALHSFAMDRIVEEHFNEWGEAFEHAGRGSSYVRAQGLRDIYGAAAPVPGIELSDVASMFLAEVRKLVAFAIREAGGGLVLEEEYGRVEAGSREED